MSRYEANGQVIQQHLLLDAQYQAQLAGPAAYSSVIKVSTHFGVILLLSICIYSILRMTFVSLRYLKKAVFRPRIFGKQPKSFDVEKNPTLSANKVMSVDTATHVPDLLYLPDLESSSSRTTSPGSSSPSIPPYSPPAATLGSDVFTFPKKNHGGISFRSSMDGFTLRAR